MTKDRFHIANLVAVDKLYRDYRKDPASVDPKWHPFFAGMEFASEEMEKGEGGEGAYKIYKLILAYRKYGHLYVYINPLKTEKPPFPKELELERLGFKKSDLSEEFPTLGLLPETHAPLSKIVAVLQEVYCSRIGIEYMDLDNPELEEWIQKRIEPKLHLDLSIQDKKIILDLLNKAEIFESFLHTKFVGQKRFSLEGGETLIPILQALIDEGGELGVHEFVIAMAHRGRLNVLANIMQKSYPVIFYEFESTTVPLLSEGTSDVKYHNGFASDTVTNFGKKMHLHIAANSSHLEAVNAVVLGQAKAKQVLHDDEAKERVAAVLIHGDAAIAGQGIIYECMQFMNVDGYSTGGSIHIIVNNQVGFTTLSEESRSTRYCTDISKAFGCPSFHVNAEDPESCYFAAKMAAQIRQAFKIDVFIDLICYRKYGHNEGDEPNFTQPLEYQLISKKKNIRELYAEQLISEGVVEKAIAETLEGDFKNQLQKHLEKAKEYTTKPPPPEDVHGRIWEDFKYASQGDLFKPEKTGVSGPILKEIAEKIAQIPEGFTLHPKLIKLLDERMAKFKEPAANPVFEWGFCESLAFGSLLWEGRSVRLAGQDSQRGTFSQRHAVWVDQKDEHKYFPLQHIKNGQGRFVVLNSPLSEYAAMGFEYGYSWSYPSTLVLWEAQYGDFSNGAQIMIDQFLTTSEQKWQRLSALVLLLPHGMEGQGPEHSSARMERFLTLCGHNNMQVVYPSTPAQYFHLLRKQAIRVLRKPLVVFTPKSLLRLPACVSSLNDLSVGMFEEFLPDPMDIKNPQRLLICTGKLFYELLSERERIKAFNTAILRVEQFYPFHEEKFQKMLAKYSGFKECFWIQEEPENMGAWHYMMPILQKFMGKMEIGYIGRARSASPAAGSNLVHRKEQKEILELAFKEKL